MKIRAIFILILFTAFSLFAQEADSLRKVYTTKRIAGEAPVIDGSMDESAWDAVEYSGGFSQYEPYSGREPSQPTYFKILFDDENLYVGILCYDSVPNKIVRRVTRRDGFEGDRVTIVLDSYYDKRTGFSFTISAAGVKGDEYVTEDGDDWDETWDPIWYAKTTVHDTGYTAEMRIPYTQLRFGKKEQHVWGLNVYRMIFRHDEADQWQFIAPDASGLVRHFGELHGIEGIKPKRQADFIPYFLAQYETFEAEEGNPYMDKGNDHRFSLGLDGKVGITYDLTLDMTINPDFGQVEADPSEVNLTGYETFFQEKRPFFIEGSNIINFPISGGGNSFARDNLFYSRRIGRQPHYYPETEDGEYVNMPQNSTILGAFKVTGKTKDGWSVGLLESVTQKEVAEIDTDGEKREEEVEPLTNYFTGRLQKDINKGNTIIGGMFTATNRKITNPAIDFLPDAAYTGGIDFQQYFNDRTWHIKFKGAYSNVQGDSTAITSVQRSSVHYYQRPDADYIQLDSTLTSFSGYAGTVEVGRLGSGHFNAMGWVTVRSPSFETNDVGYLRSADEIFQVLWVQYRIWEPFSIFRRMNINVNQWSGWDFGGRSTFYGGNINFNTTFKNNWSIGTGFNRDGPSLHKGTLRGGPSFLYPGAYNTHIFFESDDRKKFGFEMFGAWAWAPISGDRDQNYGLDLIYRPLDALRLVLSPFAELRKADVQYVITEEYESEPRYIVSDIDQTTVGIVARIDYSITPDMSIQYYGSPFVSAGDYKEFKLVTQPQAEVYTDRYEIYTEDQLSYNETDEIYEVDENVDGTVDYSFENPNFNFMQFRSNLVFRWEYIPGSVVYLVWTQDRTDFTGEGQFDFGQNMDQLFSGVSRNIFLVKVSYRIKL